MQGFEFPPKNLDQNKFLKPNCLYGKLCIHWHLFLFCDRIKLPTSQKKQEGCWQHIIILYPFRGQKSEFFRETCNPFYVIRILVCYIFAWIRSVSNVLTGPWRAKVIKVKTLYMAQVGIYSRHEKSGYSLFPLNLWYHNVITKQEKALKHIKLCTYMYMHI